MSKMRVVQVSRQHGELETVEREIPEAVAGSVRVKVAARGICHSDSLVKPPRPTSACRRQSQISSGPRGRQRDLRMVPGIEGRRECIGIV
jgi:NADPH:quinone reductase-like Zn-dependent oxidoreductase